jgi:hypothetical protein
MSADLYWPVLATRTEQHILWVPGVNAEDAARRLRHQDVTLTNEQIRRSDDWVGGGISAETLPDLYDPYEYNEQYGPRLPDGSFWGPATLAIWAADRAARLAKLSGAA